MKNALGEIIYSLFVELGWERFFDFDYSFVFYILLFLLVVFFIYYLAWIRLSYYARKMDSHLMELWEKEEYGIVEDNISNDAKKIRLERLRNKVQDKIEKTRKKRDFVFKVIPFMGIIYRKRKGKNAPMYTLP